MEDKENFDSRILAALAEIQAENREACIRKLLNKLDLNTSYTPYKPKSQTEPKTIYYSAASTLYFTPDTF